jgi:N-acetylmuramoyl-L-alanine amidase
MPANYVGVDGLVERSDLGTLNRAGVPAVMIECGNMRRAADAALFESPDGRRRIAQGIAAAVAAWRE